MLLWNELLLLLVNLWWILLTWKLLHAVVIKFIYLLSTWVHQILLQLLLLLLLVLIVDNITIIVIIRPTRVILHLIIVIILGTTTSLSEELHAFMAQLLGCTNHCIGGKIVRTTSAWHLKWAAELRNSSTWVGCTKMLKCHGLHSCWIMITIIWRWGSRTKTDLTSLDFRLA